MDASEKIIFFENLFFFLAGGEGGAGSPSWWIIPVPARIASFVPSPKIIAIPKINFRLGMDGIFSGVKQKKRLLYAFAYGHARAMPSSKVFPLGINQAHRAARNFNAKRGRKKDKKNPENKFWTWHENPVLKRSGNFRNVNSGNRPELLK